MPTKGGVVDPFLEVAPQSWYPPEGVPRGACVAMTKRSAFWLRVFFSGQCKGKPQGPLGRPYLNTYSSKGKANGQRSWLLRQVWGPPTWLSGCIGLIDSGREEESDIDPRTRLATKANPTADLWFPLGSHV